MGVVSAESSDDLTFASARIEGGVVQHVHWARCWPCMFGSHPGGWHRWADIEDVQHAAKKGLPDPSGGKCGCSCADQPAGEEYTPLDSSDSLTDSPCPSCGESGACGVDAEGRPMIHATWMDEDD